jgi:hypothetical protein
VTELTDFDFKGMLNGNTFEVKRDPGTPSTGTTTIQEATFSPVTYDVSSSLQISGEYSFNGSPFVIAPQRTTSLDTVPEPGPAGAVLVGVLGIASCCRRLRAKPSLRRCGV